MELRQSETLTEYDLQAEVATEAHPSLDDDDFDCAKNPGHPNFIPFDIFQLNDIPETYRSEKIYRFLKNFGNSVVRLTVCCEDDTMRYGTGVIMKYRGKLYIYTNNHVIATDYQANNCTIDFNYNSQYSEDVKYSQGTGLVHTFSGTDKSMITFDPVPEGFDHEYMPDSGRCRAIINIKDSDDSDKTVRGLACVHKEKYCIIVKQSDDLVWTEDLVKTATAYFREFDNGSKAYVKFSQIIDRDDEYVFLEMVSVPDIVRIELDKEEHFWDFDTSKQVLCIVISHPHGGPKMVTFGQKINAESKEEEGFIMQHSAPTCGGSSGGVVIAAADNNKIRGMYSYLYLHCKGRKTDKDDIIPQIDSHNVNTSSLSIWL